jgi:hypothetical protein
MVRLVARFKVACHLSRIAVPATSGFEARSLPENLTNLVPSSSRSSTPHQNGTAQPARALAHGCHPEFAIIQGFELDNSLDNSFFHINQRVTLSNYPIIQLSKKIMSHAYYENLCDRTLKARAVMKSKKLPPPFQHLDNSHRVYPTLLASPVSMRVSSHIHTNSNYPDPFRLDNSPHPLWIIQHTHTHNVCIHTLEVHT